MEEKLADWLIVTYEQAETDDNAIYYKSRGFYHPKVMDAGPVFEKSPKGQKLPFIE